MQQSRRNHTSRGCIGRPKGKQGVLWNTLGEYSYEDISSDKAVKQTKKQDRTHALEVEGSYISTGAQSGCPIYVCDEHLNCPKKRRVVYGNDKCIVEEYQREHSTASNPNPSKRGITLQLFNMTCLLLLIYYESAQLDTIFFSS